MPPAPPLDEPVFAEPWQAQAFALNVALHGRGLFTWREWADALAAEIAEAQAGGGADPGDTYYLHWLVALERIVGDKVAGSIGELARCRDAWAQAAARTAHGQPIALRPDDFA
jgi:nitrile hydratase accessory protein